MKGKISPKRRISTKKREVSNQQILNKIKKRFTDKLRTSESSKEEVANNFLQFLKEIAAQEFDFQSIHLQDLQSININADEKNLMVKLSVEQAVEKPVDDDIKNLLYLMGFSERNLQDLDEYLHAGFDLYQDLLADYNDRTSGTLIQYCCVLLEEYVKKIYAIKTDETVDKFLTLAPLLQKVFNFSPFKNERGRAELEGWQVPLIWGYELRNLFMHNILPLPQDTFTSLYYVLNAAVLLATYSITKIYSDWFKVCPKCHNKTFMKYAPPGKLACIHCGADL
jgi:hypothetical protein